MNCSTSTFAAVWTRSLAISFAVLVLSLFTPVGETATSGEISPSWNVSDEVFYHFMPIAWRDGNQDVVRFGDFEGMTASLDYLDALGITAIWMNPIFPTPAYHGYQHGAGNLFNDRFGDESEFVTFLEAAHARGIKVFVDFVAYGISQDSPWFEDAYGNPNSEYDDWLAFTNSQNTDYFGSTYPTWNGDSVGFIHWDLRHPGPVGLVTEWAERLLDPNEDGDFTDGLDGYRLDHVWETYPNGPDGWGYHIDDFWVPWREALREVNPEVFIFAEQADWGSHGIELLPGMDAVFTKPFEFAARWSLQNEDAGALYDQMATTVNALRSAPEGTYLCAINDHDIDRLASVIGDSFEKGKVAAAVLLTQPFPPVIYYGDELGMRGVKNTSYLGDAADIPMREPFKWNAVAGPPMSNYFLLNSDAYNGRYARDGDGRSVEEQEGDPASLLEAYRSLIAVRHENVGLRRGDYSPAPNSSNRFWSFLRYHEDQAVLVVLNLHGQQQSTNLDLSGFVIEGGSSGAVDLLTDDVYPVIDAGNQSSYGLTLDAYEYVLLEVDLIPPTPPAPLVDGREIPSDFDADQLRATQDNGTGLGDNLAELNQLFVAAFTDSVYVGVTGNLDPGNSGLCLFFDTQSGGQNILELWDIDPPPSGPRELTGLRFDAGFTPDLLYYVNVSGPNIYLDRYQLLSEGGTLKQYRGNSIVNTGEGFLSGGSNPNGMQMALDNTNTAGVTESDPSGAATATTGIEIYLPFAELGLDPGTSHDVGVTAFLIRPSGEVSNQWLPGLGGGYDNLGMAPDLRLIPDDQHLFVTLDPESTGAVDPPLTAKALEAVTGNPFQDMVSLRFGFETERQFSLSVHDVGGRQVREIASETVRAGVHLREWDGRDDEGRDVPTGIYLARLQYDGVTETCRLVRLR